MRFVRLAAGMWLTLCAGGTAAAAWHRASSPHFVIYADQSPKTLQAFATRLETFDKAARHIRQIEDPGIGDGNRLTIFVVPDEAAVQRLKGDRSGSVAGFYSGRATGSIAIVPRSAGSGREVDLNSDIVFFHEYAHHLMFQNIDAPYPEWLIEGSAEFMSTAQFEKDGSVGLGIPPLFRAYGLLEGERMRIRRLLTGNFDEMNAEQRDVAYGRSWLLTHYLTFNEARSGQLGRYLSELARGTDPVPAAQKGFGDLDQLDGELDKYLTRSRVSYIKVAGLGVKGAPVEVKPLSPGAAAVMTDRIQSKVGVDKKAADLVVARVRAIESKYGGDVLVERTLAEAELDAGHPDTSLAAAERALAADPRDVEAMIFKGRALMAGSAPGRFDAARKWFIAANKIDTEDPEPLMVYYESYGREGRRPTANAIAGLHYASNLAPQDGGLRLNSAIAFLEERKLPEARRTMVPVAYDPHGGEMAALARKMIARIDANDPAAALKLLEAQAEGSEK